MVDLQELTRAVIEGDRDACCTLTRQAIEEGIDPLVIFRSALVPGMDDVGRKMSTGECYIPEVLMAARAMKAANEILGPLLAGNPSAQPVGRVILGTVFGDLHEIGKDLVKMMLEGAGFEVTDLGCNVPAAKFVAAVQEQNARIVALSALLTTTILAMGDVIKALDASGLRGQVKVMVGGGAVTQEFADQIGADGFSPDAAGAVDVARSWVKT